MTEVQIGKWIIFGVVILYGIVTGFALRNNYDKGPWEVFPVFNYVCLFAAYVGIVMFEPLGVELFEGGTLGYALLVSVALLFVCLLWSMVFRALIIISKIAARLLAEQPSIFK